MKMKQTLRLLALETAFTSLLKQTASPVADWDDKMPRISWRGDGQFFVVSAIHPRASM